MIYAANGSSYVCNLSQLIVLSYFNFLHYLRPSEKSTMLTSQRWLSVDIKQQALRSGVARIWCEERHETKHWTREAEGVWGINSGYNAHSQLTRKSHTHLEVWGSHACIGGLCSWVLMHRGPISRSIAPQRTAGGKCGRGSSRPIQGFGITLGKFV